ncbi:hypothetical protein PGTUg99_014063 [Puccinia graminis f. sp. tritici]|uniref:Uncharacterized protein n=1 Tax=Puccinia graminis f. sp. tritici TaxID=56615 RepID=A0A5B0SEC5_PUCGR|nr:hypothetical protein PGTUg99_014063 [Puccinia graminis f. sp. tritici]
MVILLGGKPDHSDDEADRQHNPKEVSAALVATSCASSSVPQISRERNRNLTPASRPVSTPEPPPPFNLAPTTGPAGAKVKALIMPKVES